MSSELLSPSESQRLGRILKKYIRFSSPLSLYYKETDSLTVPCTKELQAVLHDWDDDKFYCPPKDHRIHNANVYSVATTTFILQEC